MKSKTALVTAMAAGLLASFAALPAAQAGDSEKDKSGKEKGSCGGKHGCKGDKDKSGCSGKGGCGGKKGDKDKDKT